MLKFFLLSALTLSCTARPYEAPYASAGYGANYGSNYGAQPAMLAPQRLSHTVGYQGSSYGSPYGAASSGYRSRPYFAQSSAPLPAYGQAVAQADGPSYGLLTARQSQTFEPVVTAAIKQVGRTVEYLPVAHSEAPIQPQVIEIEPSDNPVHLHFKTRSSTLSVSQSHVPAPAQEVQTASEQDEPQRLLTEVQKPVIQEVREVITPYRQVEQVIHPVSESLHTVVSKGEAARAQYNGAQYEAAPESSRRQQPQYGGALQATPTAYAQPARQSAYVPATSYVAKPASVQSSYPAVSSVQPSAHFRVQPTVESLPLEPEAASSEY